MQKILVGKNQAVGSPTSPIDVPEGAIAIFNGDTNTLLNPGDTITDASQIYFVQGVSSGSQPVISIPVDGTGVRVWKGQSYVAPVKQVSYVGYSGSGTLTINTVNSGNYLFGVNNLAKAWIPFNPKSVSVTADSSATAFEIADAIAEQVNAAPTTPSYISDPNNWIVKLEVLSSQSSTAIGGGETLTVVNGSNIVTSSGTSHGIVAGDAIRIGSTTALTSPVYPVASVNGATITLTREYAGDSASGVAAGELDAYPDASDLAGLKVTALSFGSYFSIFLAEDFEGTQVTYTTPYTPGSGTYDLVLDYEKKTRANWGYTLNRTILPIEQDYYATSGTTYDLYYIEGIKVIVDRSFPSRLSNSTYSITIAIPSTATAVKNAFEATINPWINSTPGAFPSVNL